MVAAAITPMPTLHESDPTNQYKMKNNKRPMMIPFVT